VNEDFFAATPGWRAAYPGAHAGVLVMRGLANPVQHAGLEADKAALEQRLRERYAGQDRAALARLPVLQAYAAYYKGFKKTYHVQHQLESVALKGRPLPAVAALVEAMFMAELEHLLLTAGHDLDVLALPVRLDVARGGEGYVTLRGEAAALKPGDMFMADAQGIVSSILYGPDQRTAITPATRAAMFTVYAPPGIEAEAVRAHLRALEANVRVIGPEAETALVGVVGGGGAGG
jgi:DNA/RNA-binding domain of Phe-tRNA-synthetase-like protein